MKQVFLIGDSVRQGYDRYVAEAMSDTAVVKYSDDNSMYALHVLRWLSEYKTRFALPDDIDCIHWNVGLWDTVYMNGIGVVTPLHMYEDCIERICKRMKLLFPEGKFIFATSTPVIESRYPHPEIETRYNSDIEAYNRAAVDVVRAYGHAVDDLYASLSGAPESYYDGPTHPYTVMGTRILTTAVVKAISECIGVETPAVRIESVIDREFLGQ